MQTTTPLPLTSSTFADWYRSHHPGLVEALVRAIRPEALACDALDEACAKAFASWEEVQALRSPAGWVYRVAVNEARRQLRRAEREETLLATIGPPATAEHADGEAWMVVGRLPIRQRTTVVLRHVAGMTEVQVAAAMGVTRSTVSSSLASAYRTLAVQLGEDRPKREPDVALPSSSSNPFPSPSRPSSERFLAVARSCTPLGCDLGHLDGTTSFASYAPEVLDVIKVRPGDLVAVDAEHRTIVWRWWNGRVATVDGNQAAVVRNVTQRVATDPRQRHFDVELPEELAGAVHVGQTIWFGSQVDRKVAVAVAGPDGTVRNGPKVL